MVCVCVCMCVCVCVCVLLSSCILCNTGMFGISIMPLCPGKALYDRAGEKDRDSGMTL